MTLNLISFMFNLTYNLRIMLVIINELIHFSFIQQIAWYIPHNGSTIPLVSKFFCFSTIITTFLLIELVLLRQMRQMTSINSIWIDIMVKMIQSLPRVGGFFEANIEEINQCVADNEKMIGRKLFNNYMIGDSKSIELTHIIDRMIAICVWITYTVLLFALMPY